MNQNEYWEHVVKSIELMNTSFEFWMTATFAVLVAVHFMRKEIDAWLYRTAALMYSLLTFLFLVRWWTSVATIMRLGEQMTAAGFEMYPAPPGAILSPFVYLAIVLIGFTAVIGYMKKIRNENSDT